MNGLLVRRAPEGQKNIGDYIQSLAQEQFWDHIDLIVDRERLNTTVSPVPGEKINLIMNSWWMWQPENWPPTKDICPLFVSFHISPFAEEGMLSEKGVAYLKANEPIGARDTATMHMLEKRGVKSYFSACLTLTLGKTYLYKGNREGVCVVDPEYSFFQPRAYKDWFRALFNLLRWHKKIKRLMPKFFFEKETVFSRISESLNKKICATLFFDQYRRFFDDEVLLSAEYLTHIVQVKDYPTNEACLDYARILVNQYARARMVITSRIHAALPSLGLETPVFFVKSKAIDTGEIAGRLDGLMDLFNYRLEVSGSHPSIHPSTSEMSELVRKGRVTLSTPLRNSDAYIPYRDDLIARAEAFVKSCSHEKQSDVSL